MEIRRLLRCAGLVAAVIHGCGTGTGEDREQPASPLTETLRAGVKTGHAQQDLPCAACPAAPARQLFRTDTATHTATSPSAPTAAARLKVLLIGNSYTRFNQLPLLLARIAAAAHNQDASLPEVQASLIAHGGYDLGDHIRAHAALHAIATRHPTHVIIQDHSTAFANPAPSIRAATLLGQQLCRIGAQPVVYQTWPRHPASRELDEWGSAEAMLQASCSHARTLAESVSFCVGRATPIARVGEVFAKLAPTLPLHRRDLAHPTLAGTYLAALVIYQTLVGKPLVRDVDYVPYSDDVCLQNADCVATLQREARAIVTAPEPTL